MTMGSKVVTIGSGMGGHGFKDSVRGFTGRRGTPNIAGEKKKKISQTDFESSLEIGNHKFVGGPAWVNGCSGACGQ